jgi:hypothetical protein
LAQIERQFGLKGEILIADNARRMEAKRSPRAWVRGSFQLPPGDMAPP